MIENRNVVTVYRERPTRRGQDGGEIRTLTSLADQFWKSREAEGWHTSRSDFFERVHTWFERAVGYVYEDSEMRRVTDACREAAPGGRP